MIKSILICISAASIFLVSNLALARKPASKNAKSNGGVSFASPKNGDVVPAKFKVKFSVKGKKIRPAGEDPNDKATGHHHLIIDGRAIAEGQVIPTDDQHKHFGKGQKETELELPPGVHSLTLQFADGAHLSYGPKFSQTINVEVK